MKYLKTWSSTVPVFFTDTVEFFSKTEANL